jgi:hypothetical protein
MTALYLINLSPSYPL